MSEQGSQDQDTAVSDSKSPGESLAAILDELRGLREDIKGLTRRIELLEVFLLTLGEEEEDEEGADFGDESERALAWARLREELGIHPEDMCKR